MGISSKTGRSGYNLPGGDTAAAFAAGAASVTSEWYDPGIALFNGIAVGVIRDPSGLASGAPTYFANGNIRVPLSTGIIAATPDVGWSITIPAKTDLNRDPRAVATFFKRGIAGLVAIDLFSRGTSLWDMCNGWSGPNDGEWLGCWGV